MLHQHDIEVIDDHLAGKENDGLQSFAERHGDPARAKLQRWSWLGQQIGGDHGDDARPHRPFHPEAERHQQVRAAQAGQALQHEIKRQSTERMDSLDISAAHSQWNVKRGSQRQQRDQSRSRAGSGNDSRAWLKRKSSIPMAMPAIHA